MPDTLIPIRRALLSVSNKTGLVELAQALSGRGVALLASGGTRKALQEAGIRAVEVSEYTGSPEILGGRVKTLHPKIHGGILARRDSEDDLTTLQSEEIEPIDLVVVNLYPFEETIQRPGVSLAEAIEKIDIGGPTLIRAASKNYRSVAVLTNPTQYQRFLEQFEKHEGLDESSRLELARSAFGLTSRYERAIQRYLDMLESENTNDPADFPEDFELKLERRNILRYGENPHQRAAFYVTPGSGGRNLATGTIRHGKELSYNNLLDLDSALRLIRQFEEPAACVLKHNNPCGAAIDQSLDVAFEKAYEGDPVSAFGGIVGVNRVVDEATADRICTPGRFIECIIAPGFDSAAFEILTTRPTWKNSVRLIELNGPIGPQNDVDRLRFDLDFRRIDGGMLVQEWDQLQVDPIKEGQVVTDRAPNEQELTDLAFAWRVCQSVKSNAIVLARSGQLVGVGAGQMSRLDSVNIAVTKSAGRSAGAVLASDAFFPFRDGPDAGSAAGVTAIIQPGGSKRDEEVIGSCNEHQIAMIFTGRRHFRH